MSLFKSRKIFRYILKFGFYYGLNAFFLIRRSKKSQVTFNLPNIKYPVNIRKNATDCIVFEEIFIDEIYKMDVAGPVDTLIDAGANTGLATLYFLSQYKPKTVICIEPNDVNFEELTKNLGKYKNVHLYKKALWKNTANLKFKDREAASWAFEVIETKDTSNSLPSISLNELKEIHQISEIDILKIDIEGSEKEVFEDNTEWIESVRNLIIETHENMRPGAHQSVFELIKPYMKVVNSIGHNYLLKKK